MTLTSPHRAAARLRPVEVAEAATVASVSQLVEQVLAALRNDWAELTANAMPGEPVEPPGYRGLRTDSVLDLLGGLVATGGKRFRPRMAYWGWVAGGGHSAGRGQAELVRVGAALELLHVFALIHDDVMDGSETRRGQASVHAAARREHVRQRGLGEAQRYGENIAILAGDLAHSEAGVLVAGLPAPMQQLWRTLAIELMMGQGRDLVGAANGRRDLDHARGVARAKSGAYTVWRPLQLGAAAAGASPATMAALERYGIAAGEAFALRDDILGVVGDHRDTGKPVGDDLATGKPTVLMALAAERFSLRWRRALERAAAGRATNAELTALRAELVRSGVIAQVEAMIAEAVAEARSALADPAVHPDAVDGLAALVRRMAWRAA